MRLSGVVLGVLTSSAALAITVAVERLPDGAVRVDYELPAEATELNLVPIVGPIANWRANWTVPGEALSLEDDRIASPAGAPFSVASVRIEPAEGAASTALFTMGARSSVIDLRALLPQSPAVAFRVRNAFDAHSRACVDELVLEGDGASTGAWFVVVSTSRDACQQTIRGGDVTLLAEDAPAQLQAVTERELVGAHRRLAEKLGRPLDAPPTLILAHRGRASGGVTRVQRSADTVVLAALEGDSWIDPNARQANALAFSITRALAPAWLVGIVVPPPEPLRVGHWLADGAAQYLAMVDRQMQGAEIHAAPAGRMMLADIGLCSIRVEAPLGRSPSAALPVDRDPLGCGLLVQFVYDAVTRAETAGLRTIFDVWADVLAEADGGPIDTETFLAMNERARAAVAGLVYGPAADFDGIAAALRNAGIDASVGEPLDTGGAVLALLRLLVSNDCTEGLAAAGPLGGDRVPIKTRGTCRTLPPEVALIALEGVGIATSAGAVYEATATACAERGSVRLTGALAAQEFEVGCPASVPALPRQLFLRNVQFLN